MKEFTFTTPFNISCLKKDTILRQEGPTEIIITPNIKKLDEECFRNFSSLRKIIFKASVKTIPRTCFYGCSSLEEVQLTFGLKKIDSFAFTSCLRLKELYIPATVEEIGIYAFRRTNLEKIAIPDKVKVINAHTFALCDNLKTVILPKDLEKIDDCAFFNCTSLEEITLPEGLKTISQGAFNCESGKEMKLKRVFIPSSVEYISPQAFAPGTTLLFSSKKIKDFPFLEHKDCKIKYEFTDIALDDLINMPWESTGFNLKELNDKLIKNENR